MTSSWWPLLYGHLSNTDTLLCPFSVRIRETRLYSILYSLGCGGTLNKTSGVLYEANGGDEADEHCIWKIGKAGVSHAVAIFTLESNCR